MVDESPSIEVIQKVATLEGVDPVELSPPLYDVIDPEALDSLFQNRGNVDSSIEFEYCGYTVVVDGTGSIDVTESDHGIYPSFRDIEGSIGD